MNISGMVKRGNNNEHGIILVGLVVLVTLAAVAFSVAIYLLGTILNDARTELTRDRLRAVEGTVQGHQYLCHNDAGSNFGYFAQANGFPATDQLDTLVAELNYFMDIGGPESFAKKDAWGTDIDLETDGTTYTVRSAGRDTTLDTGDDIDFDIPEGPRDSASIGVQIIDATVSGYRSPSFIISSGENAGHTILDGGDLTVRLYYPPFGAGDFDALTYQSAGADAGYFTANNVSMGWRQLYILPNFADYMDPPWLDQATAVNNLLVNTLYVAPCPGSTRQRFNIVVPVITRARYARDPGDVTSHTHEDMTIDSGGLDYDGFDDVDPLEYNVVGSGDPDGNGTRIFRSLFRFDLTHATAGFPNFNIGAANPSKVVWAELMLHKHKAAGSGWMQAWLYSGSIPDWDEEDQDISWAHISNVANYGNQQGADQPYSDAYDIIQFDVTEAVQNWADTTWSPTSFVVICTSESGNNYWAYKSEESDMTIADSRPKLIIAYYP